MLYRFSGVDSAGSVDASGGGHSGAAREPIGSEPDAAA
jgi:hypothetical protein